MIDPGCSDAADNTAKTVADIMGERAQARIPVRARPSSG